MTPSMLALGLMMQALATAQPPPAQPPEKAPEKAPAQPPGSSADGSAAPPRPKSLDEILGTGPAKPGAPAAPDQGTGAEARPDSHPSEGQAALRRALTEQEAADAFQQAVAQMARSAAMLDNEHDAGLDTQRVQQDVLEKLDLLLKQRGRKGNSQSASQRQRQQQQQQVPNQQQDRNRRDNDRAQDPARDSNPNAGPPKREEALLEQALESAGTEWGSLPERVRDMIRQGLRDRPSSLYLRLTEDYYRRLAEEAR